MEQHKEQFHGSDLEKVEAIYGIPKEQIISFGANVNPLGLSEQVKEALAKNLDCITVYPDRNYSALRAAISSYCNVAQNTIMVGNGSTELISLFIQCRHPKKAVLIAPTYSEYERELTLCGSECIYYYLKPEENFCLSLSDLEAFLPLDTDLLILCNPNNPTSSLIPASQLRSLLQLCAKKEIFLLVDETYVEFTPDIEAASGVSLTKEFPNLAILRGVSKFFAAPGLRLGYAITSDALLLEYIRQNKNPWTINSVADLAGQLMFRDTAYIERTRQLIHQERTRICERLERLPGITVFQPYANFLLVRLEQEGKNADLLFEAAIRQRMMLRSCADFPSLDNHYFRFCIMMPAENEQLLSCLENFLNNT